MEKLVEFLSSPTGSVQYTGTFVRIEPDYNNCDSVYVKNLVDFYYQFIYNKEEEYIFNTHNYRLVKPLY